MNNKPMKILFVDDEVAFLETLIKRLKKRGMDVSGINSGEAAITILEANPVDLVVLDVCMPGMDGIEVLKKIKSKWPAIEVIMLTGHTCLEAAGEGMETGAFDYLLKPIDIDDLLFKLEDAYDKIQISKGKINTDKGD